MSLSITLDQVVQFNIANTCLNKCSHVCQVKLNDGRCGEAVLDGDEIWSIIVVLAKYKLRNNSSIDHLRTFRTYTKIEGPYLSPSPEEVLTKIFTVKLDKILA